MKTEAAKDTTPARELRVPQPEFGQAAQLVRIAVELARENNTKTDEELQHAWALVQQAREIIAPTLSEVEATEAAAVADGASDESINALFGAITNESLVRYDDLISETVGAGQASVELRAPIRRDESLRILDPAAFTWKKMTWEGFTEAVGRVTAQQFAAGGQSLNAALVGNKGATAAFSRATPWMTLSLLADLLKEHFPDVPDVKRALETWSAIKDGFEAERVLYDCLEHCNWADATQGTAFLDEWEQRGADHWQRSILAEFRAERTLRLGLVWNIFLARKGGAKARSASAAATRKSRSRNGARRSKRPGRKKAVN